MLQADAVLLRPKYKLAADALRPVVAANSQWFAAPLNDLIQYAYHALSG
jgi:hypothetical protein